MTTLGELADVFRSKNAGPFSITIDLMFKDMATFERVVASGAISPAAVATRYRLNPELIHIAPFPKAKAIKITLPRLWGTRGSGSPGDRDVYGAQQHAPLLDLPVP
jgi:Domain of unknown function (DUF4387)